MELPFPQEVGKTVIAIMEDVITSWSNRRKKGMKMLRHFFLRVYLYV